MSAMSRMILLVAVPAVAGLAMAAEEPKIQVLHQMPGPAHVEMKTSEVVLPMELFGGRPVVSLRIDGKGPYRFVLDTGAGGSVMKDALGDTLGLETLGEARVASPTAAPGAGAVPVPGPGPVSGHGPVPVPGPVPGPAAAPGAGAPRGMGKLIRIGRLEMGDATLSGLLIVATDLSRVFPASDDPAGVLSVQALSGNLVTFDYPGSRIVLRPGSLPAPNRADVFEYDAAQGIPTLQISVAGVPMEAHLDSGSGRGLTLPGALATRLPLGGPLADGGKARTVDGEMPLRQAPLAGEVRIGRFGVDNPTVSFAEGATIANVGYDILKRYAVTIDPRNRRVRLEEPAAPAAAGARP